MTKRRQKMKTVRKLLALVLVLAMAFALCVPAFADSTTPPV